jgi:outer membrane protein assembly factor BamA
MGAMTRVLFCLLATGCASIPPDRYAVESLEIRGIESFEEEAIEACIGTAERDRFGVRIGLESTGPCGQPPFDPPGVDAGFWSWPWTDWPLFDRVLFEQDIERIERWYQARGFHEASVTETNVTPAQAIESDVIDPGDPTPGCEREDDDEGCIVDVEIVLEEGRPTIVREIEIEGLDRLPSDLREDVRAAMEIHEGDRFDEAIYDVQKQSIQTVLADAGYARAAVEGAARIDRPARSAAIAIEVRPGPLCVFGDVIVEGAEDLPVTTIRAATLIDPGDPYDPAKLDEAQRAIYQLGGFASVLVEPEIPDEGNVVDVKVTVRPARTVKFGLGAGVQSGVLESAGGFETISVPEWDVHLRATYENRNFLGGLRQLELEERPRLIVLEPFPSISSPELGNTVRAEFRQPAFFEPRTTFVLDSSYDYGPDPFDFFFRHKIDSGVALERSFLYEQRLFFSFGIRNSIYLLGASAEEAQLDPCGLGSDGCTPPAAASDSMLTFFEELVRLDLRDEPRRPRGGMFVQLGLQEAGYILPSSWSYIRALPEVRFYVPLPWHMTLASRFALGMLFITSADPALDDTSEELGPRDYRLRGGGASSNRGFLPGRLGDGIDGGLRRWEASAELRIPVFSTVETAFFLDAGDVHAGTTFRFDHPQVSVGLGFRIYTIVTVRIDFAYRIAGLQVLGGEDSRDPGARDTNVSLGFVEWPGAVHITLGEPF